MAHESKSIGPANLPKGGATENQTTPVEQRAPQGAPLSDGPKRGKNDEYLPASYPITMTVDRGPDRDPLIKSITRTDR